MKAQPGANLDALIALCLALRTRNDHLEMQRKRTKINNIFVLGGFFHV